MPAVIRRVHVEKLKTGSVVLDAVEAHHVRDVLRLAVGTTLELFDDAGAVATGQIEHITSGNVVVSVESISAPIHSISLTVAAAVPKGDRADWMVEKLTELGVTRFIPLITARSVVLPAGKNKIQRWERIAIEAAKQSRRVGVMTIDSLLPLDEVINSGKKGWYLSTAADLTPVTLAEKTSDHLLLIGPEGGWTDDEIDRMTSAGLVGVGLTSTVLRVETAAVIAAGVFLCLTATRSSSSIDSGQP